MGKTYKTAMGKTVDMSAMILANEKTRAVGNMKVNARGDIIDSNNNIVKTKQQQLAEQYSTQTKRQNRPSNVQRPQEDRTPVETKPAAAKVVETKAPVPELVQEPVDFPEDVMEDDVEVVKESVESTKPVKSSGLAAAIARTKETKKQ